MGNHRTDDSVILVVGNLQAWEREGRSVPVLDGFRFVEFQDLGEELQRGQAPQMVLSALTGDGYDALDIASCLQEMSFRGTYRALAERLPDAEVVREEVRSVAPDLDFDLLILSPSLPGR